MLRHLGLFLSVFTLSLGAADGDALPPGGRPLLKGDLFTAKLIGDKQAKLERIDIKGQPFDKALRLTIPQRTKGEGAVQLILVDFESFGKNDVLFIRFWARCVETKDESGAGRIRMLFASKTPGSPPAFFPQQVEPDGQWKRYDFPMPLRSGLKSGEGTFALQFGNTDAQTLELGGFVSLNYGSKVEPSQLPHTTSTYEGREPDAPWRAEAQARIEQFRKGDLRVQVVDAQGRPAVGAQVHVEMLRHAYRFGTMVNRDMIVSDKPKPDAQKYQEMLLKYFNHVTVTAYWRWQRPGDDEERAKLLTWLHEHHLTARAHPILWPSWQKSPDSLKKLYEETKAAQGEEAAKKALSTTIEERVRHISSVHRGQLTDWDVINETFGNHDLMDILGEKAMADWFRWAREGAGPDTVLFLNENSVLTGKKLELFMRHAALIRDAGGPIGGVGEQGHGSAMSIPKLIENLNQLATLKLPIQITEFDIVTPDEELQADWTRDYMTVIFSHPSTVAFVMWGFWDGNHWLGDAPLFTKDWTLKLSGKAYEDLVFKQWRTDVQLKTDTNGQLATRGFLGDYRITVTHDGKTRSLNVALPKEGATAKVEVK